MLALVPLLAALPDAPVRGIAPAAAQQAGGETRPALMITSTQEPTWARIRLDFAAPVTTVARAENGVLVVRFAEPVEIVAERIGEEIPSYVSQVRRDPDGTGLRMALTQNFSASVLPAGEIVFVDLLPEAWRGMPPGLPEDVVAELARRAQAAEARFSAERAARREGMPTPMPVRVAELPGLTRLIFAAPEGVPVEARSSDGSITLFFDERLDLEPERLLPTIPGVAAVEEDDTGEALYVRIDLDDGFVARGFREEEGFVLDVEPRDAEAGGVAPVRAALGLVPFLPGEGDAAPIPPARPRAEAAAASASMEDDAAATQLVEEPADEPVVEDAAAVSEAPAIAPVAAPAEPAPPRSVPVVSVVDDGLRVVFPFGPTVPAAAFTRAGVLMVVFQTPATLAEPDLGGAASDYAILESVVREGPFVTARMRLPEPRVARLTPEDAGWTLTVGGAADAAPDPIAVGSIVDEAGRTALELDLLDATGVHWTDLHEGGERLAVVTAPGPARNMSSTRRFAELELLPTAHGIAVAALADDVVVRADLDGVHVTRGNGLSIALPSGPGEGAAGVPLDLVIDFDAWTQAQRGDIRDEMRARLDRIVEAPIPERSRARLDLAFALLANRLAPEAAGMFQYALEEDPELAARADVQMMEAILAAERRRFDEAEALLSTDAMTENPEASLWRAYADAMRERWVPALTGFRRAARVLDAYPDDLQGRMRLAAARAGLAMRDFGYADEQLTDIARLHPGAVAADEVDLVRALVDVETGRTEFALAELTRLAQEGARPIAAEAELARVRLALVEDEITPDQAIEALERLAIAWRGDSVEVEAMGMLGRLYADAGRWRDAFFTAHMANLVFPDHPVTLALHETTAQAFDDLFLSGRADDLDEVEAVALFFDFKEFLPIGRRGDEIVRRLADRLVTLGLLDKASELLAHQVDNRLEGAGRAAVAARLATIHLMNRHPADALTTIENTRIAELPQAVRRVRNLIEARALSDLSRTDLALEVIEDEAGPEIDRLRADIWWTGRRWREAGEAHEALAGTSWQEDRELTDRERTDVLRAALAYNLGQDGIGLDRLKAKFADPMNASADARLFALLGDPDALATPGFRDAARDISSEDTLLDFLAALEARHPEAALSVAPVVEVGLRTPEPEPDAAPEAEAPAPITEPTPVSIPGPEARAEATREAL
ncbi:tetratricopeptide repeat protein [Salinarimonas ramus]|uniref:Tetratricopeptide repeat protein n=1 Tax=Salinarimonas ramus TaxID=690164 RepID=A0A917Q9M8_9HYPH|nr:hypothetical protein [Salinarimonas ramus]GGK37329.1 hypothetical protein GCM10011322_25480 [Salinarimonas ramus]